MLAAAEIKKSGQERDPHVLAGLLEARLILVLPRDACEGAPRGAKGLAAHLHLREASINRNDPPARGYDVSSKASKPSEAFCYSSER
jgi:hypothetical protein